MTIVRVVGVVALIVGLVLCYLFVEIYKQHTYDRAHRACLAYAREHVPDVDPVAWCEP